MRFCCGDVFGYGILKILNDFIFFLFAFFLVDNCTSLKKVHFMDECIAKGTIMVPSEEGVVFGEGGHFSVDFEAFCSDDQLSVCCDGFLLYIHGFIEMI